MGFLVAAVVFMAVSVLIVQRVAQYFGIAVHTNALVLCAVAALVVNFSAILLSAYLTFSHLMMLVILVLFSAILVTGINEYFLRRDYLRALFGKSKGPKPKPIPVLEEEAAEEVEGSEEPEVPEEEPEAALEAEEAPPETGDQPEQEVLWEVELPPGVEPPEQEAAAEAEPTAESAEEPKLEPEPVPEVQEKEPEPEPVAEEPTPEPEPEPVPEVQEQEPESEPVIASVPETVVSLDDHLDYAYAEKEAGHVAKAAAAYQQAVERFADDPYVPFLVIELGNLYKEAGAYDVAVNTYRDALSLPVIQGQAGIAEEFQKNIAYLEAVSHITTRHDAPETPFSQIPPDWIAEIEAEFAKQTGN